MVNTYNLVNPYIQGSLETSVQAKNSIEAGKLIYNNLSEHFNNNLPKFLFTIQKGHSGKGKYYNFKVKESKANNEINFSIDPITIENESAVMDSFNKKLQKFKQKNKKDEMTGGAKKASKKGKKSSKKASKKASKKSSKKESDEDVDDLFADINIDDEDSPKMKTKLVKKYVNSNLLPINYFWYDPYVYRMNSVYIPTFYSYVTPYIQIDIRSPL